MSKKVGGTRPTSTDQNSLIRENMKCPVCLEVLLPPIYQCEAGHNICSSCVENVHVCPLCKSDYGDTRNYFAEELVNSLTFPCKYEEYGCKAVCLGSKLKDHQDTCEYQPYQCPELACKEVFGIQQLGNHMDKHGFPAHEGDSHIASIEIQDEHFDNRVEYNPWRISAFGKEFYTLCVRTKDKNWFFWAWMLGEKREAKDYSYEIAVFTEENHVAFRGQVQSLRISPDDLMKGGNCMVLTDSLVKAMRKDKRINCSVRFIKGKLWDVKRPKRPTTAAVLATATKKVIAKTVVSKESQKKSKNLVSSPTTGFKPNTPMTSPYLPSKKFKISTTGKVVPKPLLSTPKSTPVKSPTPQARPESANSTAPQTRPETAPSQSRRISDEENKFLTKLKDLLRCPGCGHIMSPPIQQCVIGHNICSNCRAARDDCPLCRAPFGISRNFYAEELLYRTTQRCRYSSTGCQVCLPTAQIRLHELTCEFAPFECPFHACRKTLDPRELMKHLQSHNIPVVQNELMTSIAVPKRVSGTEKMCSIPSIIMVDGFPFYPLVVRDQGALWAVWLTSKEYGNYRYEFILKKQSKVLAYQGPVLSLRADQSDVISNGLALITTDKAIKGFKTNEQLEISVKICKNLPYSCRTSIFSINLDFDLKKDLKSSKPKTKLYANKCVSASPALSPRYFRREDFEGRDGWNDSSLSSRTSLSGNDGEGSTSSQKACLMHEHEYEPESSASEESPTVEVLPIPHEATSPSAAISGLHGESISNEIDALLGSKCMNFGKISTCAIEKLIAEFEARVPKGKSSNTSVSSDMSKKHPLFRKPEAVASSPIIASLAQVENVRINAFKRKRCLHKLQKLLVARSTAILKKCNDSDVKFHSNQIPVQEPIIVCHSETQNNSIEAKFQTKADKSSSETGNDFGPNLPVAAKNGGNSSNTSIKSEGATLEPEHKKLTGKPKKSSIKSKKRSDTTVVTSSTSLQEKISRSSSFGIPVGETAACLDISVEEEGDTFSEILGSEEHKNWTNFNYSSDIHSEGEEDDEIVGANRQRSNLRVKFADQSPENSVQPSTSSTQNTADAVPKPKKSALKMCDAQTSEMVIIPEKTSNQNKAVADSATNDGNGLALEKKISKNDPFSEIVSSIEGLELELAKRLSGSAGQSESEVEEKSELHEDSVSSIEGLELELAKRLSGSTGQSESEVEEKSEVQEESGGNGLEDAAVQILSEAAKDENSWHDLIDLSERDTKWGIIPPNRFDTAMFETDPKSRADILSDTQASPALLDGNGNNSTYLSEYDLLRHTTQQSALENEIIRGFKGDALILVPAGKSVSIMSMGNIRPSSRPRSRSATSNRIDEDIDDGSGTIIFHNEETQTVEEVQTACQVGSSLLRISASDTKNSDQNDTNSDESTLLEQSYETMTEGLHFTLSAVKSIFSGIASTEGDDDIEEEVEDYEVSYFASLGEDLDSQCITGSDDDAE